MLQSFPRISAASAKGAAAIRSLNGGVLLLFLLFTTVVGVRKADAQTELTIAGCVVACSGAFVDFRSSVVCGACMVWGGRRLGEIWLGEDTVEGFACAKADIGC